MTVDLKSTPRKTPRLVVEGCLVPELDRVAFVLKVGEVSTPIETSQGFYIIMRTNGEGTKITEIMSSGYRKDENFQRYFNRGLSLMKESKWEEAIKEFERAIKINPDDSEVHKKIGIAYGKAKSFSQARYHLKESLRLNPNQEGAEELKTIIQALESISSE